MNRCRPNGSETTARFGGFLYSWVKPQRQGKSARVRFGCVVLLGLLAFCGCKAIRTAENTMLVASNALMVVTNDLAFFTNFMGRLDRELTMTKKDIISLTGILKLKDIVPQCYNLEIEYTKLSFDNETTNAVHEWTAIYEKMFASLTNHPQAMRYFNLTLNAYRRDVAQNSSNYVANGTTYRIPFWQSGTIEAKVFEAFDMRHLASIGNFRLNLSDTMHEANPAKFESLIAGYVNQLEGTGTLKIVALQLGDSVILEKATGTYRDQYKPPTKVYTNAVPSEDAAATTSFPGSAKFALNLRYVGLTDEVVTGSWPAPHRRIPIEAALRGDVLRFKVKQQVKIPDEPTLDIPIEFEIKLWANFDLNGSLVWTGEISSDAVKSNSYVRIGTIRATRRIVKP